MSKINTLILLSILFLPQTLLSETAMKCETGKCSAGKEDIKKDIIIPKLNTVSSNTSNIQIDAKKLKQRNTKPTVKQLFNVKTIQVKNITSAKEQVNYGYVVAQDALKIDVTTRYSGYVDQLFADTLYKKVKKGDVLAKVYSAEVYRAKQDYLNSINYNITNMAPAMLKSAQTNLLLLGVNKQEITTINKQRKVDEFTTIYAPISGWIFEKNIHQGSSFNSNKKLFQIINLERVWVEVKLFQDQIKTLDAFDHFTVKTKSVDTEFKATYEMLYPMLDPKEATATLRLSLPNLEEKLKPGMYVKVHSSTQAKTRLIIPRTAVIRKNGTWYAFLATEFKGEYEPVKIEIKPLDHKNYEVIQGLHANDSLVNNALFMMDSDAQINAVY